MRESFNSLQTGRHIRTCKNAKIFRDFRESIGFQFPSNGKAHSDKIESETYLLKKEEKFQFPSNGKAHSDESKEGWEYNGKLFQFPSNGKAHSDSINMVEAVLKFSKFQFPSNGKAHSDSPHFKPSGAMAPEAQNQTRTAHAFFLAKIYAKNATNLDKH